jgi:hypothetical protein
MKLPYLLNDIFLNISKQFFLSNTSLSEISIASSIPLNIQTQEYKKAQLNFIKF